MKTYRLCRNEDVSGTSGTGYIAQMAEFDDGTVAVRWVGSMNASGVASTTVFNSLEDVLRVHGHNGKTVLQLIHDDEGLAVDELQRRIQDLERSLKEVRQLLSQHGIA